MHSSHQIISSMFSCFTQGRSRLASLGICCALIGSLSCPCRSSGAAVSVVAGDGTGNNLPATRSWLRLPSAIAADSSGNIYFMDRARHRIRKITPDGLITTVLGEGDLFLWDLGDRPMSMVGSVFPSSIATDSAGHLLFGEVSGVWETTDTGSLKLVAGTRGNKERMDVSLEEGKPATSVGINSPSGMVVDAAGNLYLAETWSRRVRKVDTSGKITLYAGLANVMKNPKGTPVLQNGVPATTVPLSKPQGLATDSKGNLYIADAGYHVVRKVAPDGTISTLAGTGVPGFSGDGGPAASAQLNTPMSVAVDGAGNMFIADRKNQRIRRVSVDGTISTVAGTGDAGFSGEGGAATAAMLRHPTSLAIDSNGGLLIADTWNHRIRRVGSDGLIVSVVGAGERPSTGENAPAVSAALANPTDLALGTDGSLYIVDQHNNKIRRVGSDGLSVTVAGGGNPPDGLGDNAPATGAALKVPEAAVVDSAGSVYIEDTGHFRVRKVTPDGIIATIAGNGKIPDETAIGESPVSVVPSDLAVNDKGTLYILDAWNARVWKIGDNGGLVRVAGNGVVTDPGDPASRGDGKPATEAALDNPKRILLDPSGNLYILEHNGFTPETARKVGDDGIISTVDARSIQWNPANSAGDFYFIDSKRGPNLVFKNQKGTSPSDGDADQDKEISLRDAIAVLRYIVRVGSLSPGGVVNADANGDGEVTLADVVLILRKVVGL